MTYVYITIGFVYLILVFLCYCGLRYGGEKPFWTALWGGLTLRQLWR